LFSFFILGLFSFAIERNLGKFTEKKALFSKIVPKVFSGFEKWTFIFVHFFIWGVFNGKKTHFLDSYHYALDDFF
jgi:hypothetical protein